ncbi:MAG: SurA N-terminal domain-containing protein [Patescibacteria group bacterium]
MINKKKLIIFSASAVGIIVVLILFGVYPIALVGISPIMVNDYNRNYSTSLNYYEKALKTYAQDSQVLKADEARQEIKRAVLDNLIENILIEKELKKEIKQKDLNVLVENKIKEISESQITDKAIETLYSFSLSEFKKRVLKPQAKKEILEDRFFLAGIDFDERMKSVRSQTKVMIFLTGFEWNGEEVISSK